MNAYQGQMPGGSGGSGSLSDFEAAAWADLPPDPSAGTRVLLGGSPATFTDAFHASKKVLVPDFTLDEGALHADVDDLLLAEVQAGSDGVGLETWTNSGAKGNYTQSTEAQRPLFLATGGPQDGPCLSNDGSRDYDQTGTLDQLRLRTLILAAGTIYPTALDNRWALYQSGGTGAEWGVGFTSGGLRVGHRRTSGSSYTNLDRHATAAGTTPLNTWYAWAFWWDVERGQSLLYFGESSRSVNQATPSAGISTDVDSTASQAFANGSSNFRAVCRQGEVWRMHGSTLATPTNALLLFEHLRLKCVPVPP